MSTCRGLFRSLHDELERLCLDTERCPRSQDAATIARAADLLRAMSMHDEAKLAELVDLQHERQRRDVYDFTLGGRRRR